MRPRLLLHPGRVPGQPQPRPHPAHHLRGQAAQGQQAEVTSEPLCSYLT